ncbi:MAG: class I cytochrome c [Anaerolineaceae bacterium]|nr:MAG: class I cytochrome c [Anaerolineaceae bacterium]
MTPNPERTQKIETLLGITGTLLIVVALFLYILNEPVRIAASQGEILAVQLNEAMTLYAENCSVCHGLAGEGIGATPALDSDALRTMPAGDLTRVIADGRYNTAMPAWSQANGGSLSDFQVGELTALIQFGDWQATQDRVVNLGLAPLIPFTTDPDPVLLDAVALLPGGATLQAAITIYAAQCVACHGADGLGTSIAPALNDPLVRAKTADELSRVITNGSSGTLMAGWSNVLLPEDIAAMVTLIQRWEEVPSGAIPAPDVPVAVTAESLALGANLYSANCSRCHGPDGQGTQRAPALNVQSFIVNTPDPAIQQIITLGIPGTSMPAWGDKMTDADIQAVVGFLRQWEPTAPEVAVPVRIGQGGPPWLTNSTTTTTAPTAAPVTTPQTAVTPGAQATAAAATRQPGAGAGTGNGQGGGGPSGSQTTATETASWWQTLDWRILALVTGGLVIAFTLILMGYASLKKPERKK